MLVALFYIHVVIQCLSCYLVLSVICYYCLCTVICTSFSLYTHTHHGRVLTTLNLHVQILDDCLIVQVFDEMVHIARSWTLSPSLHSGTLISPLFLSLHDSICIAFSCHFLPAIHIAIMCSFYMSYYSDFFYSLDYSLFRLI